MHIVQQYQGAGEPASWLSPYKKKSGAMNLPDASPYAVVKSRITFPSYVEDRTYQIDTINGLAPLPRAGYYLGGGTGKTYCATVGAYYKRIRQGADITVIVMPPILILGWKRWLEAIKPMPKVLAYEGTPKKRSKMVLRGNDFILMSMSIFKRDYERIVSELEDLKLTLIVDEAHSIKNISSDNHKKVFEMVSAGADILPLTATPLSTPMDGYAFVKMIAPGTYRNLKQFTNVHVEEWDYFDNPKKWQNLDLLRDNMRINSVWLQRREVKQDLPPVIYTPMRYSLDSAHYALYKQLAEEQILELENGGKIDATQESALHHAMQQIVLNWDYFSQNPASVARGLELIEEVFEEVGGKLVVVASYRMTNRKLLELLRKFNAVGAYGDIPGAQQSRNVDRFINDPECGIFVLQPTSAGYGLDGLQHVCADMLFMELPQVPKDFHQTVWRLDRDGQKDAVNVRIAVADGTIQVRKLKQMMEKNDLIGRVQPNLQDLRAAIFGG